MSKKKIEKRLPEPQYKKEQNADGTSVSPAIAKPNVVRSPNVVSAEDEKAKEIHKQAQKINNEILDKFYLLLNGMSYRKAKHILQLAIMNLSDKANLHT